MDNTPPTTPEASPEHYYEEQDMNGESDNAAIVERYVAYVLAAKLCYSMASWYVLAWVKRVLDCIRSFNAVVPNLFRCILPLLILDLFIPPLFGFVPG